MTQQKGTAAQSVKIDGLVAKGDPNGGFTLGGSRFEASQALPLVYSYIDRAVFSRAGCRLEQRKDACWAVVYSAACPSTFTHSPGRC